MKQFTTKTEFIETSGTLNSISKTHITSHYPAYTGLEVDKDTIAIKMTKSTGETPLSW